MPADSSQPPHRARSVVARALLGLLLIAPAPSLAVLAAFALEPGTTLAAICYAIGKIWLIGLPIAWLLWVERGRLSLSPLRRGGLGTGVTLGLAIGAVIWMAYWLIGRHLIDPESMRALAATNGLDVPWRYLLACGALALVNSLLEEYVFRWFIVGQCLRLMRAVPAIIVAATIFTLHHIISVQAYVDHWGLTALICAGVFMGGAAWSWCYARFGSIWPGWISHVIADLAVFSVGWVVIFG